MKITDSTLVPLSLVFTILGGVCWLTGFVGETRADVRTLNLRVTAREEQDKDTIERLQDLRDRAIRMETMLKIIKGEKMGIEVLKEMFLALADVLNIVSKVINKQGLVHLIGLQAPIEVLRKMDFKMALSQLKDLSVEESKELQAAFAGRLDLHKKDVQAKIAASSEYLVKVAEFASRKVSEVKLSVSEAKALYAEFQALIA